MLPEPGKPRHCPAGHGRTARMGPPQRRAAAGGTEPNRHRAATACVSKRPSTGMSPPSDPHRPFGSLMPTHRNVTGPKSGVNSAESEGAAINTANGTRRLEMDPESCQIKARSLPRNACITLRATEPIPSIQTFCSKKFRNGSVSSGRGVRLPWDYYGAGSREMGADCQEPQLGCHSPHSTAQPSAPSLLVSLHAVQELAEQHPCEEAQRKHGHRAAQGAAISHSSPSAFLMAALSGIQIT